MAVSTASQETLNTTGEKSRLHLFCDNVPTEQCTVRDVELCRICLATDKNLYSMKMDKTLGQAYRTLTGLSIENDDNIPPYLCSECSHQLIHCIHIRNRTLRAHLLLLEVLRKHDCITLEIIKTLNDAQDVFVPSLDEKSSLINQYDVEVVHIKKEKINTDKEVYLHNVSSPLEDFVLDGIKKEDDYTLSPHSPNDDLYTSNFHTNTFLNELKTEAEAYTEESANDGYLISDNIVYAATFSAEGRSDNHISEVQRQKANITKNEVKPTKTSKKKSDHLLLYDTLCCNVCPYKTVSDVQYLNHLKTHTDTNTYKCNHKNNLRQQVLTDTIRFSCHICNKTFSKNWGLQKHMKTHTDEKRHICNICKRGFKENRDLQNHLRTHSGEKPFGCDLCKKSFSERGNLLRHIRIHAGEKPFLCKVCKLSFSQKHHLKRHMTRHKGK